MMKTIHEGSNMKGTTHVSCIRYQNLNNLSHYHSDHELVYINKGHALVTINEKFFNLNSRKCVFIHSNDIHYISSDEDTIITVLKAENKYFEHIFASKKLLSPLLSQTSNIEGILNDIHSELKTSAENGDIMADCIAAQLWIMLLRNEPILRDHGSGSGKSSTKDIYNEISKKISNEYNTITFEEAAKHMHFSEPYFSKIFHNIFGMTFTQYLNTLRVAAAVEKIKHGNLSMTEISASCGFNTIRNFNRVFKNFTGYSPNALPSNYVFLYSLQDGFGLNPTLNCTEILDW